MKRVRSGFRNRVILFAAVVGALNCAAGRPSGGTLALRALELEPGSVTDLSGEWMYKPGYALSPGEHPGRSAAGETTSSGFVTVPVPQMLSRLHAWLDDSADFREHETRRLARLGFDTEKAEDGWYRLVLEIPPLPDKRRLFVEFEGVAMKSEAWVNGHRLGDHTGMFSRFGYDITPYVKPGKNVLSVYVSMEKIRESTLSMGQAVSVNLTASKVMTLSKGMFGPLSPSHDNRAYDLHGIWQPVRLVARGAGSLEDVWFIPSLDAAQVVTETRGTSTPSESDAEGVLAARWTDPRSGSLLAEAGPVPVNLGADLSVTTLSVSSLKPRLWTPATPHLYELEVTLTGTGGQVLDRWKKKVGFRTFEVRGSRLYLNGRPYWLRGANHLPYGKNPTDPQLARKLIGAMHDGNQRVTRTHCIPWNESWLDAADEIGLGVSIEGIRPWAFAGKIGATPPDLFQHWLMENRDVIRRCRNHPSVLIWTVGNEMLLRDHENLEKWAQLSEVVRQTRATDPTRPVVSTSSYERDPEIYSKVIEPHGFDDGDIDDIHSYKAWYANSPFVTESRFPQKPEQEKWNRPLIGQEMSTGYPDLDSGLPTLRYTANLLTPQAWVGRYAYPGNDPAYFLEHHRAVTKRWAEQLRFQRGERTAGFLLFANECWWRHSFDADTFSPYPVVEAMRDALAPIGLALETGRRRFTSGEALQSAVFITNDDEQGRDLEKGQICTEFVNRATGEVVASAFPASTGPLSYYATARVPVRLLLPRVRAGRMDLDLNVKLLVEGREISRTTEPVEVFAAAPQTAFASRPGLRVVRSGEPLDALTTGGTLRRQAEDGATVLLLKPGRELLKVFPEHVAAHRKVTGEYADWAPVAGTSLAEDLRPMDLKWWGRQDDWRVFVASEAHRLRPGSGARDLVTFVPSHGYTSPEKVPAYVMSVLFEIPLGKGRVWVCDLDLEEAQPVDPAARLFARNLLRAAADPDSTRNLPEVPGHLEWAAKYRE